MQRSRCLTDAGSPAHPSSGSRMAVRAAAEENDGFALLAEGHGP